MRPIRGLMLWLIAATFLFTILTTAAFGQGALTGTSLKVGPTRTNTKFLVERTGAITWTPYGTTLGLSMNGKNIAGGSFDLFDYTGTLGIMDGSDTFQVFDINITGANHTGSSNVITGIDLGLTTPDGQATETALNISANWDTDINAATSLEIGVDATNVVTIKDPAAADGGTTTDNLKVTASTPVDTTGTNIHNLVTVAATIGNASGGTNSVRGIQIDNITGDAQVTETGINVGTGWDAGITASSLVNFNAGLAMDTNAFAVADTTGVVTFKGGATADNNADAAILNLTEDTVRVTGILDVTGVATVGGASLTFGVAPTIGVTASSTAAGKAIAVTTGAGNGGTTTGYAGGALATSTGAGSAGTTTGGDGGATTVTSGDGGTSVTGTTGAGGAITLTAGTAGAASGAGTSGIAGALNLLAGAGGATVGGTSVAGGAVNVTGGTGSGGTPTTGGAGGALVLTAGTGGAGTTGGAGGAVNIYTGAAGAGGSPAVGVLTIKTGGASGTTAQTITGGVTQLNPRFATVVANTDASETLTAAQSGALVTCSAAGGATTITLPDPSAATVGVVYTIMQIANQDVVVVPTTGNGNSIVAKGVATSDSVTLTNATNKIGVGGIVIGISETQWYIAAFAETTMTVEAAD